MAARLRIGLLTRRGDWRGDLLRGPDEDLTTGRLAYLGAADQEYLRIAQETAGIRSATIERIGYDPQTRTGRFRLTCYLDADNGGGIVSEEVGT